MTRQKPSKPYPDFPLYAHANGQWAKKIKGRTRFFGAWSDWRTALKLFENTKDKDPTAFDLGDLFNLFLDHKKKQATNGEISMDTWKEYRRACKRAADILGRSLPVDEIRGRHFVALRDELADQIPNPNTLRNVLVKLRRVFEWAYQAEHVDRPLRYKDALKRPAIAKVRIARAKSPKKLYSQVEVTQLIAAADLWMKAAVLMGINGGLGCRDLCEMRWEHVHGRWLRMPRDKTGVDRTMWLWEETVNALPERRSDYVFCGSRGQQLGRTHCYGLFIALISSRFRRLAFDSFTTKIACISPGK